MLTDATLLLCIVLQVWGCASAAKHPPLSAAWVRRTVVGGLGVAGALCTKWTGVSALAMAGLQTLVLLLRDLARAWQGGGGRGAAVGAMLRHGLASAGLLLLLPALLYVLCFYAHFTLLPSTGSTGAAFMTPRFRATLQGDEYSPARLLELVNSGTPTKCVRPAARRQHTHTRPCTLIHRTHPRTPSHTLTLTRYGVLHDASLPSFWEKFVELNGEMLRANQAIRTGHDWGSRWWEWPLMLRSVLYWVGKSTEYSLAGTEGGGVARIYCIGTPLVWWLAAAGPSLFAAWLMTQPLRSLRATPSMAWPTVGVGCYLALGYLLNWLPFMIVERVAFLYHFLPSLIYSLLLLGFMFDRLVPNGRLMEMPAAPAAAPASAPAAAPAAASPPKTKKGKGASGAPTKQPEEEAAAASPLVTKQPEPFAALAATDGVLRWVVAAVLIQVMAASFAFFAPLMYGTPITKATLDSRMWVQGWR